MKTNYKVGDKVRVMASVIGLLRANEVFTITKIDLVSWAGENLLEMTLDEEFQVFEEYLKTI
uniref:Uncharacterized protein n=1 Tax=viral metagenome TaxID=1070528 RepID=A0A6H1ZS99_9ZZZZ